ncbi:hypothetical protein [Photobacterium angustum]|uniref:hypothetical protein n=1 Tax=Photobacterium angustum TaxID=661 RepID=UPI000ABDC77B|nr:hypothetical protein [Photobacterium angustum]
MPCIQRLYVFSLLLGCAFFHHYASATTSAINTNQYLKQTTPTTSVDHTFISSTQRYRVLLSLPKLAISPLSHQRDHLLALLQQKSNVSLSYILIPIEKLCLKRKKLLPLANFQFRFTHSREPLFQ